MKVQKFIIGFVSLLTLWSGALTQKSGSAVAAQVLFDSMSLPSAGEGITAGLSPYGQCFETGSFASYLANISVNLTPLPGPAGGLPSIQLYLWSDPIYSAGPLGILNGPAYPNGVATYTPTESLLLAPNTIYWVSALGTGGGYLSGYYWPAGIGIPVGNPGYAYHMNYLNEHLEMQVQVELVPEPRPLALWCLSGGMLFAGSRRMLCRRAALSL